MPFKRFIFEEHWAGTESNSDVGTIYVISGIQDNPPLELPWPM